MQEEIGVSVIGILSAHLEHDLCPHHPPYWITSIHSANHVRAETRRSSKVNARTLQGQILGVTFQGTLWPFPTRPTSPSHRPLTADPFLTQTGCVMLSGFSGGAGWDTTYAGLHSVAQWFSWLEAVNLSYEQSLGLNLRLCNSATICPLYFQHPDWPAVT